MARSVLPGAITAEHVILAFGGLLDNGSPPDGGSAPPRESPVGMTEPTFIPEKPAHTGGAGAVLAILALAIPLTILLGMTVLHDRAYYFISLLVLLETMVPFFLHFERRKPQARELVVLAVLCALGVGGRAAFFMLPQVKPMTALVVIAGVCLGGETGFLVGAVTAFCSNLLFGQGPWTPWQMLALGLIGFLAGVVFAGNRLRLSKPMLCLFGGVAALVIYGGIMNPAAVLLTQPVPSLPLILTSYAMGFPFDLIHAVSTALFLWLIGEPMVEKLSRMREKYGILSI
jgi:energy-coupling factor transport system ATP-binding protein